MQTNTLVKWTILGLAVIMSAILIYPPAAKKDVDGNVTRAGKVRLGLDMQGGYSFTVVLDEDALGVIVRDKLGDDASDEQVKANVTEIMKDATERALDIIRKRIDTLGTEEPVITRVGEKRIQVQIPGVTPEQRERAETLIKSVASLDFRLVATQSAMGLLDSGIAPRGYKIIDVAGKSYYVAASRTGTLPTAVEIYQTGKPPQGYVFMLHRERVEGYAGDLYTPVYVSRRPLLSGSNITKADARNDTFKGNAVGLTFDAEGRKIFANITGKYAENGPQNPTGAPRQLAIVLDGIVQSAPWLKAHITNGAAEISGNFTISEVREMKNMLNSGAMPAPLKFLGRTYISPTLGEDAVKGAQKAIFTGLVAIVIFLIIYYRRLGVVAGVAIALDMALLPLSAVLASNILSLFTGDSTMSGGSITSLPVLTLPGIAGILLMLGMAVDANVLIYERIREEQALGRPPFPSIMAGYQRAFLAIFDGNITTVITAIVLFIVGMGPIRGFSITLVAGIIVSMYTALMVTKMIFRATVSETASAPLTMMSIFPKRPAIKFTELYKPYLTAAVAIIVVTLAVTIVRGAKDLSSVFGIDFTGGTKVTYTVSDISKASLDDVKTVLAGTKFAGARSQYLKPETHDAVKGEEGEEISSSAEAEEGEVSEVAEVQEISEVAEVAEVQEVVEVIEVSSSTGAEDGEVQQSSISNHQSAITITSAILEINTTAVGEEGKEISDELNEILMKSENLKGAGIVFESVESIGSQIGAELKKSAFWAVVIATIAMLIYIGVRFEWGYGLGAVAALTHDVLITMGVFACLGFKFDLTIVAALLTIVGYGVNNTIVVFDRVREELKRDTKTPFPQLVSNCLNITLSRSILTSGTTLITVVALFVFSSGDIRGFATCILIGIIASTFSSLFVAAPVTLAFYKNKRPVTVKGN